MKNTARTLAFMCAIIASGSAFSASYYAGVGITNNEFENKDVSLRTLEGLVGLNQNEFLGWEARVGFGLDSDVLSYSIDEPEVVDENLYVASDVKISYSFGLFVKPQYAFKNIKFYSLLGYSKVNLKADNFRATLNGQAIDLSEFDDSEQNTFDEEGLTFGIGAGLLQGRHSLNLEWRRVDSGVDTDSLGVNYQYSF